MDRTASAVQELIEAVRKLRGPGGCNWDRSQTLQSLSPYMLEEAYEVAGAVESGNREELKKELGDLLLHIIMASEICGEEGDFHLADVAAGITGKLIRRHPHVFLESAQLTPEEVEKQWETIKSAEKKKSRAKFFDSIPTAMPELQKAWRIQQRASEVGFSWPSEEASREMALAILKETARFTGETAGELLFQLVNLLRRQSIEPERSLRARNRDFMDRFDRLEELLHHRGCSLNDADRDIFMECSAIVFEEE